jgi:hypothetical protein
MEAKALFPMLLSTLPLDTPAGSMEIYNMHADFFTVHEIGLFTFCEKDMRRTLYLLGGHFTT